MNIQQNENSSKIEEGGKVTITWNKEKNTVLHNLQDMKDGNDGFVCVIIDWSRRQRIDQLINYKIFTT